MVQKRDLLRPSAKHDFTWEVFWCDLHVLYFSTYPLTKELQLRMFSLNFTSEYIQLILLEIQLNELDLRWSSMDFTPDFIGCQAPPMKTHENSKQTGNSKFPTWHKKNGKQLSVNFWWHFEELLRTSWWNPNQTCSEMSSISSQEFFNASSRVHKQFIKFTCTFKPSFYEVHKTCI